MKIQIFYNRNYLPFNIYINSIYHIFINDDYFRQKVSEINIINSISQLTDDTDFLILFLNDIEVIYNVNTKNTKVIFIHADFIVNHSITDQELMKIYINEINPNNSYIWEYNQLNIKFYEKYFSNKKWTFIPLLYNDYLENIYKPLKQNIPFHEKKIDVLFLGSLDSERRNKIFEKIKLKFKFLCVNYINNIYEYINYIENSKIVINIYSKDNNKPFDYYRFALLYSNRIFVLTETPENIDFDIEKNMIEFQDTIIHVNYNDIFREIEKYLEKSEEEINQITEKSYTIFKKFHMNQYIIDFFESFETI